MSTLYNVFDSACLMSAASTASRTGRIDLTTQNERAYRPTVEPERALIGVDGLWAVIHARTFLDPAAPRRQETGAPQDSAKRYLSVAALTAASNRRLGALSTTGERERLGTPRRGPRSP